MKIPGNQKSEYLSNFWKNRYHKIGHTGWKDPIVYAYDQIERLAIVSNTLESIEVWPQTAIDFGCGTGDFSCLLMEKGFRVWGYDPFVSPSISHPLFTYIAERKKLKAEKVGLILSITVLDHILDDNELEAELTYLRKNISERGLFLMIEYALDESISARNKYQAFRTTVEWRRHLEKTGWEISSIKKVPHPNTAPSLGFTNYQKGAHVRLIKRLSRIRILRTVSLHFLKMYAEKSFDKYGIGDVNRSPLKLITCKPSKI